MKPHRLAVIALSVLFLGSATLNVVQYARHLPPKAAKLPAFDDDQKMLDIGTWLDQISPQFVDQVQSLAQSKGSASWGCGPVSYSLAKIIDKKFFNNALEIDPTYDNQPYEIVERFGLAQTATGMTDHAWIEIYFKDKFMLIDPTIGQFGKYHIIAHDVFSVGGTDNPKTMQDKYGIVDVRLRLLVQKAVNRVPKSQEPYPGMALNDVDVPYFQAVIADRNTLDSGKEPDAWKPWSDVLIPKYSGT